MLRRPLRWALPALLLAACGGGSPLLPQDAAQGIDGLVLIGPQCPVVTPTSPCPDVPYATTLDLLEADGSYVTRLRSSDEGRFRVGLRPGRYRLEPRAGNPFPYSMPVEVTVPVSEWVDVTIYYDTGLR